jgi:hypothetical protein
LSVATAGSVSLSVAPEPDPDGLSDAATLEAVAEADGYVFDWTLGLTASTVRVAFQQRHATVATLRYTIGYTETVAEADRPTLNVRLIRRSDSRRVQHGAAAGVAEQQEHAAA